MVRRGFSLIELLIVVMIIGVIAGIAVGRFGGLQDRAAANSTASTLRAFERAAMMYRATYEDWPPSASMGVMPPEFEGFLNEREFESPTRSGGRWRWIHNVGINGTFLLSDNTAAPVVEWLEVDAMLDDGVGNSGIILVTPMTLIYQIPYQ